MLCPVEKASIPCDRCAAPLPSMGRARALITATAPLPAFSKKSVDDLAWKSYWITRAFPALDAMLSNNSETGMCCHGDSATMADCCLIPQVRA